MPADKRVLIAGAGPVGMISALVLAKAGMKVSLFERRSELAEDLRASTFHPPTLDMIARIDPTLTADLHSQGLVARHTQFRDRKSGLIAEFVVSGDADIAVQQIPEIMAVPGVDYVGPLPAEINSISVGRAGLFTRSTEPALTQALLDYLQTPAAAEVYRARGLEPQF